MPAAVALTGVPGTGKSATAARLSPEFRTAEVSELALAWGLGRRTGDTIIVDLERMRRRYRRDPPAVDLVVGHLAHLLPLRDVIVLRCHPARLVDRLKRSGRGSARDRRENFLSEALDLILAEALRPGRRIWEVDTTSRSPNEVAQLVTQILRRRPHPQYGDVDWLADPKVTEHLWERTE